MIDGYWHPAAQAAAGEARRLVAGGDYLAALSALAAARKPLSRQKNIAAPPAKPRFFSLITLLSDSSGDPFTDCLRASCGFLELAAAEVELLVLSLGQGAEGYALFNEALAEIECYPIPYNELMLESPAFQRMLRHCYCMPENKETALKFAYRLLTLEDGWVSRYECEQIRAADDWNEYRREHTQYLDIRATEKAAEIQPLLGGAVNGSAQALSVYDCMLCVFQKGRMNRQNEFTWMSALLYGALHAQRVIKDLPKAACSTALYERVLSPLCGHVLWQYEHENPSGYGRDQAARHFLSELEKLPGMEEVASYRRVKEALPGRKSGFSLRGLFGKR